MTMKLEFTGSEKQVKWAKAIAVELHRAITDRCARNYGVEAAEKIADRSIKILHETTNDAEVWIDRRNDPVEEILTVVSELLKKAGNKTS